MLTNFLEKLRSFQNVAIIGLSKNIGKTTTMNALLKLLDYKGIALTSIGYDGEDSDLVFGTHKPNIHIKEGMLVATAKKCVIESQQLFEIIETTGFNTPLGEIIIVRAMEDGLVKLAGPSYNAQLKEVLKLLHEYGANQVFVDGALNRKTFSDPSVCDATILCSGMTLSDSIEETVNITKHTLNVLLTDELTQDVDIFSGINSPVAIVEKNNDIKEIDVQTTINSEFIFTKDLNKETKYLYLQGPLTDKTAKSIIKNRKLVDKMTIVVNNSTNIFIKDDTMKQIDISNIDIKVLHKIEVEAVALNPNSLYKCFNSNKLVETMRNKTDIFVYDFVKGDD